MVSSVSCSLSPVSSDGTIPNPPSPSVPIIPASISFPTNFQPQPTQLRSPLGAHIGEPDAELDAGD
jgi:hypothetical protein